MRFRVGHHSWYRYDVPVALAPHIVRLTPRDDGIALRAQSLRVVPEPVARRTLRDAHGNDFVELSFAGICQELSVESELDLDTRPPPAIAHGMPPLPWPPLPWPIEAGAQQLGYHGDGQAPADASVRSFAERLAGDVSYAALPFLDHLTHELFTRFDRRARTSGDAHSAPATLASGSGACRDLSVLFMEACRCLGIASRFVSGYQALGNTFHDRHDLHAWPEVALPGIGFRGWDPTHGVRVGDGYVALCAAPDQAATMPIAGGYTFNGPIVRSTLDFTLRIDTRS